MDKDSEIDELSEKGRKRWSRKKIWAVIAAVAIIIVFLIPIPLHIKDGGSVCYRPIVPAYSLTHWNGYVDENTRTEGITVEIFGMKVFDSYHLVPG